MRQRLLIDDLLPTRVVASAEGGVAICFMNDDKYADIEFLKPPSTTVALHDFRPAHDPLPKNYAHSEIRVYRGNQRVPRGLIGAC
jgi:hypothetical protein